MKSNVKPILIFATLVVAGVVARVVFQDIPNFAPVAALALFAGYYFRRLPVAAGVPLLVMAISDRLIDAGGYSWLLMLTVYGLLTLPTLFAVVLQRWLNFRRFESLERSAVTVAGFSLASSLLFFLGTNAMVWATTSLYPGSWQGLLECYVAAIPFFKYTLAGDLVFATAFFGALAVWRIAHAASDRAFVAAR